VKSFDVKDAKTKAFRASLDKLNVEKTALLVENLKGDDTRNLVLSTRNLKGVELVAGNAVHPYHLLRYDRAIFSLPAIEKLQTSLKASASKRQAEVA
jgi:large subunit ribosomal protein L4